MLEAFGLSDPGCVRQNNEDSYLLSPETGLYVVADGMGGAQAGEQASKLAVETVASFIAESSQRDADRLAQAFQEATKPVRQTREMMLCIFLTPISSAKCFDVGRIPE